MLHKFHFLDERKKIESCVENRFIISVLWRYFSGFIDAFKWNF